MKQLLKIFLIISNVCVGFALILALFTSMLNAVEHPSLVIFSMSAPIWVVLGFMLLIADFFFLRKMCVWLSVCFAICLPLAFNLFPLNIPRGKVFKDIEKSAWTLLSYNISNYFDLTDNYPGDVSPGVSYLLRTNADVVVLAEAQYTMPIKATHFTQEQMDSLKSLYPYIIVGNDITLLSKFPAEEFDIPSFPKQLFNKSRAESKAAAFMLNIHGEKTIIIGLHLQSLGLTQNDKDLYRDFTKGEAFMSKMEIKEVKKDLIDKISRANLQRACAVDSLSSFISALPGNDNLIVCGDFNDTPGCYAIRELQNLGLREAFPLTGTGYMFTYNKDRLLFQIDHVMFRGKLRPWSIHRGNLRSSDHFPLLVTFIPEKA